MRVSLITLLIVWCYIGASTAQATLIGLEAKPPLAKISQVRVQYKGHAGTLEAKTKKLLVPIDFTPDGTNWYSGTAVLSLIMQLNSDDGTLISGSMDFTTTTGKSGFPANARITAELEEFGYDLDAGKLDFHFINTVAVGDSTNPFAAGGGVLNLILEMGGPDSNPWPEDFTRSWSNQNKGTAEIAIPEPSTIALLVLGAIGLIRRRRRSR